MLKRKNQALSLIILLAPAFLSAVYAWNNGGYTDPGNVPKYATHDWIASHAVSWLNEGERWWLTGKPEYAANFLLGTELPDNAGHPLGIGDSTLHHVYYYSSGTLQDDSAADRASTEYNLVLDALNQGNYLEAALHAGIMSHYMVDVGAFGHVMGSGTDWGAETHHSDYESYTETRTNEFPFDDFTMYLSYDGTLSEITAFNATLEIAYDTTFDTDGNYTCVWMDSNYNWSNSTFKNRAGESLNLCTNYLADVLHTIYANIDPEESIACFDYLFRHNKVRMVYPDQVTPKPLNCAAAWVSDWLASAFVTTKLTNYTEGLDTRSAFVNQTTGKAIGETGSGIITFGGRFVNPIVKYAESDSTPEADRAPLKFHSESDTFYFQYSNGTSIPGASLPLSVINNDEDMFVIETYEDAEGRYIMICYGFGWQGTYAAGKYFESEIYSSISSHTHSWIIVQWEDSNGDGFVNAPGDGDNYTVIATD